MDIVYVDQPRLDYHVVKCVVVGDTGVGKTRLICSQACGIKYTMAQLMQTHVPTVWAIDHYRNDQEVLERSWMTVDGVRVSLQLWDTFGYHDKDKRFAYGSADVVLVCYSAARLRSLKSVIHHWYPEIKRLCRDVPIVLCGCQADLRYLYFDQDFIDLDKGPFFREIRADDIVPPDKARSVAKEIGAYFYESSVLEDVAINDVFTNAVRAALIHKFGKHFWTRFGNLKRISKPLCQQPIMPPMPPPPPVHVPPPKLDGDMKKLLDGQAYCDVIFVAQGVCIQAHKVCLVAASQIFQDLFLTDHFKSSSESETINQVTNTNCNTSNMNTNSCIRPPISGKTTVPTMMNDNPKNLTDTAKLLENEEMDKSSVDIEFETDTADDDQVSVETKLPRCQLSHPAFNSIELQQCEDVFNPGTKLLQTVVYLNDNITPTAFQHILEFAYTGKCFMINVKLMLEIIRAANLIGFTEMVEMLTNVMRDEEYLNPTAEVRFQALRTQRLKDLIIRKEILADVLFQLDDGTVSAHKALLMARCDVMLGMFSYNFRESSAKVIHFPGVSRDTFAALQEYLYTSQGPNLQDLDYLELIELANRMCQERLLALTELHLTKALMEADKGGKDITEDVLFCLESAQLHNANQLAAWCLWHISINYRTVYRKHKKFLLSLTPNNQVFLSQHRWPPLWYIRESDYYEKCLVDLERENPKRFTIRRGSDDSDSGCLGFCGRNRRKMRCEPSSSGAVST